MYDVCIDIDERKCVYADDYGNVDIYNFFNITEDDIDVVKNAKTYDALRRVLLKYNIPEGELEYIGSGADAVVYKYNDLVVKITSNIGQYFEALILLNANHERIIDIMDVDMNVIVMNYVDTTISTSMLYNRLLSAIYNNNVPDVKYVESSETSKVISDIVASRDVYRNVLGFDDIDVGISNVGLNEHGYYIIFDW